MGVVEVGNDEAAEEGVQLGLGHPARQQRLHPGLGERSPDGLFNSLVEIVFQGHGAPLGCRGGYGGVIQHPPNEGKPRPSAPRTASSLATTSPSRTGDRYKDSVGRLNYPGLDDNGQTGESSGGGGFAEEALGAAACRFLR